MRAVLRGGFFTVCAEDPSPAFPSKQKPTEMELRLGEKQWARIFAVSGDGHAAGTDNAIAPGLSAAAAASKTGANKQKL